MSAEASSQQKPYMANLTPTVQSESQQPSIYRHNLSIFPSVEMKKIGGCTLTAKQRDAQNLHYEASPKRHE
jgi:hypothetical protein